MKRTVLAHRREAEMFRDENRKKREYELSVFLPILLLYFTSATFVLQKASYLHRFIAEQINVNDVFADLIPAPANGLKLISISTVHLHIYM